MSANATPATGTPPMQKPDRTQRLGGLRRMIGDGAIDLALRNIEHELKAAPNDSDFWMLKAQAYQQNGDLEAAAAAVAKAAEFRPGAVELRLDLARLASMRGQDVDEIKALHAALKLAPLPERLFFRLIALHTKRQEFDEALAIADRLVAQKPDHEPFGMRRANVLAEAGRLQEAKAAFEALMNKPNASDAVITHWAALVAERMQDVNTVIEGLMTYVDKPGTSWTIFACLGKALSKQDRSHEAMKFFQRAIELAPDQATNWNDLGVLQRTVGQVKESQFSIGRSLELDPSNASGLRVAGYEHKYEYGDDYYKRVNVALAKVDRLPKNLQVEIHYAAAKAREDVGELEAAFLHYERAGRIQKELTPWSDTRMRGVLAMMKNYIKPADYAAIRAQAIPTEKPVFIVGMPRSGTTLLEQVLASHPDVFGAGELKLGAGILNGIQIGRAKLETMYEGKTGSLADGEGMGVADRSRKYVEVIEQLAGKGPKRVVDKMPGNYNWVGLLDAVLPGSKFIHSRRHPVEICLSEYRLFFPDGINFSYDLVDLGKAYRLYNDYMKHWSSLMGDKILHVRYEDMVSDLETQARRIISYIGLPWDDACLRFYESDRKVATASVTQVRKPIYTTSTNRWRKFEPYLKPLLQELGPLVAEYEEELAQDNAKRQAAAA
jgi:Flp pilus assembly protein TadD